MTELSVNSFLRVSMRCCSTRSLSSCHFDLFINYPLMFLDGIFGLPLLVMQVTAQGIAPVSHEVFGKQVASRPFLRCFISN